MVARRSQLVGGADAYRRRKNLGWIVVVLEAPTGPSLRSFCAGTARVAWRMLLSGTCDLTYLAVDLPLGLPRNGRLRPSDAAAREFVRSASSVFDVFPRAIYQAADQPAASAVARSQGLHGVSSYAWALGPRILAASRVGARLDVFEAHPEVSFVEMNDGNALGAGKKTWDGQQIRRELLRNNGIDTQSLTGADGAGADDVLDAAACAWTARRMLQPNATAATLPTGGQRGARGSITY